MDLTAQLEAFLFWKGEPVKIGDLAKTLNTTDSEVENAVRNLIHLYENRGITILYQNGEVQMVTAPATSKLIEDLTREELNKDLGKAGLETLAVIVYKGPVSRSEVDFIRGVNSSFIMRNLLIRGLIERAPSPKDSRVNLYQPTLDLTKHLGLNSIEELPEYESLRQSLQEATDNNRSEND